MLGSALHILSLTLGFQDSVKQTDTAHVYARRIDFASLGRSHWIVQSSGSAAGLNTALFSNGISIRQYGVSGIGTVSRRGADPSQVQVLWNGITLNSPMLGMTDLSLVQMYGQGSVSFTEGGNSSIYGSGSVGGTIHVSHTPTADSVKSLQMGVSGGSFGQFSAMAEARRSSRKGFGAAGLFFQRAANRFPYSLEPGLPATYRMAGADVMNGSLRYSGGWKSERVDLNVHSEIQMAQRGLGALAGTTTLQGRQNDGNLRLAAEAIYRGRQWKWINRIGLSADRFRYYNAISATDDTSYSLNRQAQSEFYFALGPVKGLAGIDVSWVSGSSRAYGSVRNRVFPAQFLALALPTGKWLVSANIRWEWHEMLAAGAVSAERQLGKNTRWLANMSQSFRRPTLNDLYWAGGGNPDLKNETGAGAETGLRWSSKKEKRSWTGQITAWTRYLNSPIVWLPENGVWKAINLEQGNYSGAQTQATWQRQMAGHTLGVRINAEYTYAVITRNQMRYRQIFVPSFTAAATAEWVYQKWRISAGSVYQGKRFTATDQSAWLPAYIWPCANICRKLEFRGMPAEISLSADNLSNTVFQSMPGRPMPQRAFYVKLNLTLEKIKNTNI